MATILIVDDRAVSRSVLTTLLGYFDHQLMEASDGSEALGMAKTNHPDLIIADILMPTMDGFELVRRVRMDPTIADTAVIFYTASYLEKEARQLALQCGVSHLITKPSEPEVILEIVNKALGKRSIPAAISTGELNKFHEAHLQLMTGKLSEVVPRLSALIEIGKQLIRERDPLLLIKNFCDEARDVIGARYGAVGILGDNGKTFDHFIISGMNPDQVARIDHYPIGLGVLQKAIIADQPFRIKEIAMDNQSVGFPENHPPMTSFLGAPIMTETQRYGAFYFTNKIGSDTFTEDDEHIVATLAAQIGIAYENALRYEIIKREIAERKIVEKSLLESEESYRSLFENLPIGMYRTHLDGAIIDANPAMVQILGYPSLETLLAVNVNNLYKSPEILVEDLLTHIINYGALHNFETLIRQYDGNEIWCLINVKAIYNSLGEVTFLEGTLQNIHDRIQAQLELKTLYNALQALFNSDNLLALGRRITKTIVQEFRAIGCALFLLDNNRHTMTILARFGNYNMEFDSTINLEDLGIVKNAIYTAKPVYSPDVNADPNYVSNNEETQSELIIPLFTTKRMLGVLDLQSPYLDAFSERDQRILSTFAERASIAIENARLYEEVNSYAGKLEWKVAHRTTEILNTKNRIEAIINSSADVILVTSIDGYINSANVALAAIAGYNIESLFDQHLSILFKPEEAEKIDTILHSVRTYYKVNRVDLEARHYDGTTFHSECVFSPFLGEHNEITGIICNLRDVTVRTNMEEELRKALAVEKELNELKSRFTAMVSHEFRTPLSIVQVNASTLEVYYDRLSVEQRQSAFAEIGKQIKQTVKMLDDILALGKAENVALTSSPDFIDLKTICIDIVDQFQQITTLHEIKLVMKGDNKPILLDSQMMMETIRNLLSNSVKYSPEGGSVELHLIYEKDQVILRIKDHGMGIPEIDQRSLFESFRRGTNVGSISGTGLGLAIVERAVNAHKGTISVESTVGVGTTFTIILPIQVKNR